MASVLTLFDLDRTFYIPSKAQRKAALLCWYIGFLISNGILAFGLYLAIGNIEPFRAMHPLLRALAVGTTYLALIRAKFATFNYQGQEVPFGVEAFYEGAKRFVYKRINRIAKAARYDEAKELANRETLSELVSRAKLSIDQDALLSDDERRADKAWLLRVLQDPAASELDTKLTLADFLLSGQHAK